MALPLRERLGPLHERDFRLLFAGTTITTAGDRLAGIALAFAVLDIGSATDVGCWAVLGPEIADQRLGGAGAWAVILSAGGVGAVLGGFVAMRVRPARPLLASVLAPLPMTLPLAGLALGWPVWAVAALNLLGGIGLSVHLTLWFTVFQREIPERAQSRVSSYDALGSFVLVPLGMAFVGPSAAVTGTTAALWLAVAVFVGATAVIAAIPSVRAIRASAGGAGAAPTMAPR